MINFLTQQYDAITQHHLLQDAHTKAFFSNLRNQLALQPNLALAQKIVNHVRAKLNQPAFKASQLVQEVNNIFNPPPAVKNKPSFIQNIKTSFVSALSSFFKAASKPDATANDFRSTAKSLLGGLIGLIVDLFTGFSKTILPKDQTPVVDAAGVQLKQQLGKLLDKAPSAQTDTPTTTAPTVINSPQQQQAAVPTGLPQRPRARSF